MGDSDFGLDNKYLDCFPTQWGILSFSLAVITQEAEVTTSNFTELKEAGIKMNLKLEN